MAWSPERIEEVRVLAATGLSASQIAVIVGGVTRNAIIGVGHRNSFHFLGNGSGNYQRVQKPRERKSSQRILPEEPPRDGMLTLTELQHNSCRWIAGDVRDSDHRYCGQRQEEGKSWCQFHCKIVYRPPEERNA